MVMLINRRIGTLKLDAVITENHTASLKVTENPVESGANVADHAFVEPRSLNISGYLVEHSLPDITRLPTALAGLRGGANFLDLGQLPTGLKTVTSQARQYAERHLKTWLQAGAARLIVNDLPRPLAPWMLGTQPLLSGDSSSSQSRIQQLYQALLDLQKSGETLQVQTGFYLYKNMLITSLSVTQEDDNAVQVDLGLREVLIVETRKIDGVTVPAAGSQRSGRAANQSAPKSPRGRTQPKADGKRDKSLLKAVLGVFS